jgi:tRNA(adenine34) deaminase
MTDTEALTLALEEARAAAASGEVPVGAIVLAEGVIVGRGQNRALRAAGRTLGNYRLPGCELFVTLEPCAMCAGAMIHARIQRLVYAAADPKAGAVCSVLTVLNHPQLNHQMAVSSGELAEESGELLRSFFRERRQ